MLPEEWTNIHYLLLLCFYNEANTFPSLLHIVNLIQAQLSKARIQLLIVSDQQYQLYPVQNKIQVESFSPVLSPFNGYFDLINQIKQHSFEMAIVLTSSNQSPFTLAYLCYLANIPIRLGQSQEFGGGVLSHCIQPPLTPVCMPDYGLHLLKSTGFPGLDHVDMAVS